MEAKRQHVKPPPIYLISFVHWNQHWLLQLSMFQLLFQSDDDPKLARWWWHCCSQQKHDHFVALFFLLRCSSQAIQDAHFTLDKRILPLFLQILQTSCWLVIPILLSLIPFHSATVQPTTNHSFLCHVLSSSPANGSSEYLINTLVVKFTTHIHT